MRWRHVIMVYCQGRCGCCNVLWTLNHASATIGERLKGVIRPMLGWMGPLETELCTLCMQHCVCDENNGCRTACMCSALRSLYARAALLHHGGYTLTFALPNAAQAA